MKLTSETVEQLMQDTSPNMRADAARQVAKSYDGSMSESERAIAEDIFRLMVRDAEMRVRQALSESLKDSNQVPHDVATTLAKDVADVATPMLEFSSVLTDEDLVAIVNSQPREHLVAIAKRADVSQDVSQALVDSHDRAVVTTLMSNDSAKIAEPTFQQVLDEHGEDETVGTALVGRNQLPVAVSERLVTLVSESLRGALVAKHELPESLATDLILEARERATMGLLDRDSGVMDVVELVQQLKANNRLTTSIILRSLCLGDIDFFETALAQMCNIPRTNAHKLVHDAGPYGLRSLLTRAGLPEAILPLARTAVAVVDESEYDGCAGDRIRFVNSVIERILTTVEDDMQGDDLEYLLEKLRQFSGVKVAV